MQNLTKELIDKTIAEIKNEINDYEIRKENLCKLSDKPEDKGYWQIITNGESNYLKFLPLFIKKLGIKKIIELGNREGLSTAFIYDGMAADAEFITIDIEKDQRYCPEPMFSDKRVKFIFGDVCDLSIFQNKLPLDTEFVFSDTIHYDFQVRDEFSVYQYLLADKALFAIDDINLNDKRRFFDSVEFSKWDLTELCHVSGWGLFLYERKEKLTRDERLLKAYQAMGAVFIRKFQEKEKRLNELEAKPTLKKNIKLVLKKSGLLK
jgi:predicted O-methyltransferase YrrM